MFWSTLTDLFGAGASVHCSVFDAVLDGLCSLLLVFCSKAAFSCPAREYSSLSSVCSTNDSPANEGCLLEVVTPSPLPLPLDPSLLLGFFLPWPLWFPL